MSTGGARAQAFWARVKTARETPGNCSRCGRPNPDAPIHRGRRGICQECRDKLNAYRKRRSELPVTVDCVTLTDLERRVANLERRLVNMQEYARGRYKRGYAVGTMVERRRHDEDPAEWDAWSQDMDINEKKRHFHRLAEACAS